MKDYLTSYLSRRQVKEEFPYIQGRGVSKGSKGSFDTFDTVLPLVYENKSRLIKGPIQGAIPKSAVPFLKADSEGLGAVATLLRCPECGSRLHQLTHEMDETDHYLACEQCDFRAIKPTVMRGFCYGDDCNEELNYINRQAYCKRHQMTITLIEQMQ